ncbi:putative Calcium-dependent protein kinase 15 [Paratrimastix pyriformis]|uniref:Calcium-dependent protein kinase 15 n=1 Tax=Paratrimastix pyriformis TaxID=342808 RepID=A0ABQ8U3C6_9EUKA|nr:putative Calcium-dependent protein kinase 15 [Paratrimastix pyriformis]KAJ4452811.1 putative Calcium-dependent protein kinase 15 [Paratrimastix pyriformis]
MKEVILCQLKEDGYDVDLPELHDFLGGIIEWTDIGSIYRSARDLIQSAREKLDSDLARSLDGTGPPPHPETPTPHPEAPPSREKEAAVDEDASTEPDEADEGDERPCSPRSSSMPPCSTIGSFLSPSPKPASGDTTRSGLGCIHRTLSQADQAELLRACQEMERQEVRRRKEREDADAALAVRLAQEETAAKTPVINDADVAFARQLADEEARIASEASAAREREDAALATRLLADMEREEAERRRKDEEASAAAAAALEAEERLEVRTHASHKHARTFLEDDSADGSDEDDKVVVPRSKGKGRRTAKPTASGPVVATPQLDRDSIREDPTGLGVSISVTSEESLLAKAASAPAKDDALKRTTTGRDGELAQRLQKEYEKAEVEAQAQRKKLELIDSRAAFYLQKGLEDQEEAGAGAAPADATVCLSDVFCAADLCCAFLETLLPPVKEMLAMAVLNEMQSRAVRYVIEGAQEESDHATPHLLARVRKLGFDEAQTRRTLQYIRDEAPIIIHFNPEKVLKFFVKDTHYRNLFETRHGGGCESLPTRMGWEDKIFNRIYPHSCLSVLDPSTIASTPIKAFDRPKYGVVNFLNDEHGVRACSSYGDSYLLLKNVRLRTTFASCDTSSPTVKLASCEHYAHILATYSPAELKAVIEVSNKIRLSADSSIISEYKEIQIHGPVEFSRDIEAVFIRATHRTRMRRLAEEFGRINNVPIIWV